MQRSLEQGALKYYDLNKKQPNHDQVNLTVYFITIHERNDNKMTRVLYQIIFLFRVERKRECQYIKIKDVANGLPN